MTLPHGYADFETAAIGPRPHYPPKPVGVALMSPRIPKGKYLAFGHPTGNNCTEVDARRQYKAFCREHRVVCHNAGFDLDVAETHWGERWPGTWDDTMLLSFLEDPDSDSLSLKPLAERYLGEPPTEQDRVKEWILANVKGANEKRGGKMYWGKFICLAPGDLVGRYAVGDVRRTRGIHQKFQKTTLAEPRLTGAYARELKVTKILVDMERRGVPIDVRRLERDVKKYDGVLAEIEQFLWQKLKVPKARRIRKEDDEKDGFAWSGPRFAERLLESGLVEYLPLTKKGNPSTSAESLLTVMPAKLAKEFEVASQIRTCLNTFMRPWLVMARETDGLFFARFNQVKDREAGVGATTGRLSMSPNLQNVIRSDKDERVPKLRDYIVPGKKYAALVQRDFSQQELRLLAHYEDGPFLQSYLANPDQDGHILVRDLIRETTGIVLDRRPVKDLNFGLIYGQGLALTAEKLGVERREAKWLRNAHAQSLPGLPALQEMLDERCAAKEPIWTWGGRRYYCEEPAYVEKFNRVMSFEYKMLNKLIQGSAADVTKQAMVNYSETRTARDNPMLLQVHDELILGLLRMSAAKTVHCELRDAMLSMEGIAVPMASDGKLGRVSWHQMEKVKW